MKKWIQVCKDNDALWAWICMFISLVLIVVSFILPPTGQIDSSVLAAVGEIGFFAIIFFKLPNIIQSIRDGKSLTVKHGETEVTVSSEKDDNVE